MVKRKYDYDESLFYLGELCENHHQFKSTNQSLRLLSSNLCSTCSFLHSIKLSLDLQKQQKEEDKEDKKDKEIEIPDCFFSLNLDLNKFILKDHDQCWEWLGSMLDLSYLKLIIWQEFNHVILPKTGYLIDNLCDNEFCCNPYHLFHLDYKKKKKRKIRRKLTADEVREIRRLASSGLDYASIASQFDLDYGACYRIITRQRWSHI